VLLVAAVLDFLSFRRGWLSRDPRLFAALVVSICLVLAILLVDALVGLLGRRLRWLEASGRLLLLGGLLVAGLAGTFNWAFSLQGYMVLTEGETLPLFHGLHLQEFDAGPLADPMELGLNIELVEVKLKGLGDGTYTPRVLLRVKRGEEAAVNLTLISHGSVPFGSLRFHGGAFGFAPHIVLEKDGRVFFDKVVPFTSRRDAASGVAFDGLFTVAEESLEVRGAVLLDDLDERLRGHPTLGLTVRRDDRILGTGRLRPGEAADLEEGFRVGFSGLRKWAEIDISRRNYAAPILWGGGAAMAGACVSLLALFVRP